MTIGEIIKCVAVVFYFVGTKKVIDKYVANKESPLTKIQKWGLVIGMVIFTGILFSICG